MKILLVTTGLGLGGAETLVVELALAAKRAGDDVSVVSMIEPGVLGSRLAAQGIDLHSLGFRRGRPTVQGAIRYLKLVHRLEPDVVHSHMLHANLLTRLSRVIVAQRAVINSIHNVNERGDRPGRSLRLRGELLRRTDVLADLTSHVSIDGAATYVNQKWVSAGRMLYVANGVSIVRYGSSTIEPDADDKQILRKQPDEFLWICVASLLAQKNHANLLAAFRILLDERPRQRLVLVGKGALETDLKVSAANLDLGESVEFLGERSDVPQLLKQADAFALASDFEGLPLAVLEAQAAGLPVVSTTVGAIPDVVLDGVTGVLVEPGSVSSLASGMRSILEMSAVERAHMGAAGSRRVAEQYSVDAYTKRWADLYRLTSHPRRRHIGARGAALARTTERHFLTDGVVT